jgi:hypothetical protein
MKKMTNHFMYSVLLSASVMAQSPDVVLTNNSSFPYEGMVRVHMPTRPIHDGGWHLTMFGPGGMTGMFLAPTTIYSVGHVTTNGIWSIDMYVKLSANEQRTVDLDTMDPVHIPVPTLPDDLVNQFGGLPHIDNVMLMPVGLVRGMNNHPLQFHTGAGFTAIMSARVSPVLDASMEMTYYPYNPGWVKANVKLKALKDYTTPVGGLKIKWFPTVIFPLNRPMGLLLPQNYTITRGQELDIPVTVVWWDRIPNSRANHVMVDINHLVTAVVQ